MTSLKNVTSTAFYNVFRTTYFIVFEQNDLTWTWLVNFNFFYILYHKIRDDSFKISEHVQF